MYDLRAKSPVRDLAELARAPGDVVHVTFSLCSGPPGVAFPSGENLMGADCALFPTEQATRGSRFWSRRGTARNGCCAFLRAPICSRVFPPDDLAACSSRFREARFGKGRTLFSRGDPGTHLYLASNAASPIGRMGDALGRRQRGAVPRVRRSEIYHRSMPSG